MVLFESLTVFIGFINVECVLVLRVLENVEIERPWLIFLAVFRIPLQEVEKVLALTWLGQRTK